MFWRCLFRHQWIYFLDNHRRICQRCGKVQTRHIWESVWGNVEEFWEDD